MTVPDMMTWRAGRSGQCEYLDAEWCSFVGRSSEQQLGAGWLECVHPDDRDGLIRRFSLLHKTLMSFFCSYRLRHHSGEYLEVVARAHVWIVDGVFCGHYGAVSERTTGRPLQEAGQLLEFRAKQRRVVLANQEPAEDVAIENV